jgi:hypothetical protein
MHFESGVLKIKNGNMALSVQDCICIQSLTFGISEMVGVCCLLVIIKKDLLWMETCNEMCQ